MKFKKGRIDIECTDIKKISKILETYFEKNAIIDVTNLNDGNEIIKLIEEVNIPIFFASSNKFINDYIKNNSLFVLKTLINNENIDTILNYQQSEIILDLENLSNKSIDKLIKLKNINIEKYYSENPLANIFININENGIFVKNKSEDFIDKCNNINKNNMTGAVKCYNCEAYGICNIMPYEFHISETEKTISPIFQDDSRCYKLQDLSNFGDTKMLTAAQLEGILSGISNSHTELSSTLGNNNVLLYDLTEALLKLIGDNNGK